MAIAAALLSSAFAASDSYLAYSVTNWHGAGNSDRSYLAVAGDSIPLSYTEVGGGSVTILSATLIAQLSETGMSSTNTAVAGEKYEEIYPRATNVLAQRRPRFLVVSAPHNTIVDAFNVPAQSWSWWLSTNNALLAQCQASNTFLLMIEAIPNNADTHAKLTNWNWNLNLWVATNTGVAATTGLFDIMKDPGSPMTMLDAYDFDGRHMTLVGQTQYCRVVLTNLIAAVKKNAASASRADVGSAYAQARYGDTLIIPAGTASWDTTLSVTNPINITGAGATTRLLCDSNTPLFDFTLSGYINRTQKVSNLKFDAGTTPSTAAWWYIRDCNTNNNRMMVSNMFYTNTTAPCPFVLGAVGVMTSNRWDITSGIGLYIYHQNWNGELYSRGSFYDPVDYNSDEFWIVEGSVINGSGAAYAFTDAYRGARYWVRYSHLTNRWLEAHGTESGFVGGTRAVVSDHNIFHGDGSSTYAHNMRSATLIAFSNRVHNAGSAANFGHLDSYRKTVLAEPWGAATGENPIDGNDATIYAHGRASGGGEMYLVDSTKSWTPMEWVGYQLARTNPLTADTTALTDFRSGYITSNSATVIHVDNNIGGAFPDIEFAASDDYRVLKVNQAFDQPGVKDNVQWTWRKNSALTVSANVASATMTAHGFSTGDYIIVGDLIIAPASLTTMAQITVTGTDTYTFPLYTANGTASAQFEGWVYKILTYNQGLDPCYEWGNKRSDEADLDFAPSFVAIRENEHFYNDTVKPGYTGIPFPWGSTPTPSMTVSGNVTVGGNVTIGQ